MKYSVVMPPVFALVAVIGWSGSEYYSISLLEKESDALDARLTAHSSGSGLDAWPSMQNSSGKSAMARKPTNLNKLAAQLADVKRPGSKVAMMRLEQQWQNMTKEELVSALDEIDGSDTPERWSEELKLKLLQQLCKKDPETALTRYFGQLSGDDSEMGPTLAVAMREWSQKDPAKATAWLNEQIAAGKLDSTSLDDRSQPRILFEGALITALVSSDPTAAAARLNALPEGQRIKTLLSSAASLKQVESQLTFANFIRAELPEKDRTPTLAKLASNLITDKPNYKDIKYIREFIDNLSQDYTPVTDFLARISATPDERTACVEESALTQLQWRTFDWDIISNEEIDTIRAWVMEQAPSVADKMTGIALMNKIKWGSKGFTFAQAAELATQYSDASGNDEVLIAFLSGGGYQINRDEARILAERIYDPQRRQVVLDHLK